MRQVVGCLLLTLSFGLSAGTTVVVKPLDALLKPTYQSAPARVVNENLAQVSARISAQVDRVLVSVGDTVTANQPLAHLECQDYELGKRRSQSTLKSLDSSIRLARQQLSRAEKLLKQKNASLELRDQRRAELDSLLAQKEGAKVGLAEAELAIDRCIPKAPFAGVVTERMVSEGSLVSSGTLLVKILAQEGQEVSASLSTDQIERLRTGQNIEFEFNHLHYPLRLRSVIPLVDHRARTQDVRLEFVDKQALTGGSGRLIWQEAQGRLPVRYIVSRAGQLGVMRIKEGKADFLPLPKAIEGQAAEIQLDGDSQIIVEGQHSVNSGDDIVIAAQN